jgi:hypothetical protein
MELVTAILQMADALAALGVEGEVTMSLPKEDFRRLAYYCERFGGVRYREPFVLRFYGFLDVTISPR